jgi:hypothetical protein
LLKQREDDWPGSIPYLQAAVSLNPYHAQSHYRLSLAYRRSGREEEAKAEMELFKKYSKQQQENLQRRLGQITVFLADVHN